MKKAVIVKSSKYTLILLFLVLFAALGAFLFSACGGDDGEDEAHYNPDSDKKTINYYGFLDYSVLITGEEESPDGNIDDSELHKSNEDSSIADTIYDLSADGVYYLVVDMNFNNFNFAKDKFTITMRITGNGNLSVTLQDVATGNIDEHKEGNSTIITTAFTPPQDKNSEKFYRIIYKVYMSGDDVLFGEFAINDLNPSETFSFGNTYLFSVSQYDNTCEFTGVRQYYSIKEITIPAYYGKYPVTSISGSAFGYCKQLEKITLPDSITSIGYKAFNDTAFYNNPDNWIGDVLYIDNYLIEAKDTLEGNYDIRQGTKLIADYAFSNCKEITGITIPDSVTYIGAFAFKLCEKLTSITLPDGLTSIGGNVFGDCKNLTSIDIPAGVTSIGAYAFTGCEKLETINIYSGVTSIGAFAFNDTVFYKNPDNWTDGVLYLGDYIIGVKDTVPQDFDVRQGTEGIAEYAFRGCNIKNVSIPDSVTFINRDAFSGCTNLENITVAQNNAKYSSVDGVLYNKEKTELLIVPAAKTSVTIPDSVISIGDYAFSGCTGLTSLTIPQNITYIGEFAFTGCTGLTNVVFENTTGWRVSYWKDMRYSVYLTDIGDPAHNAKLLTEIESNGGYNAYNWELIIY